jgi:hypothetical protein
MSISIHTSHDWAMPCPLVLSCPLLREEWPTAYAWRLGEDQHPPLSRLPRGNVPTRGEAFPALFVSCATLPKPVDWLPVASLRQIADTLANAVTFLRVALRHTTRTLFCFQGTVSLFSHRRTKVEMFDPQGLKPETLTTGSKDPWLARAEAHFLSRMGWRTGEPDPGRLDR